MLEQILAPLLSILSAAVVVGVAGAIIGEILRFLSRRVINPRRAWLWGSLSFGEGFGFGLLIASLLVAVAYGTISGGEISYGSAWLRYAIGAAIAFAAYGIVAARRSA